MELEVQKFLRSHPCWENGFAALANEFAIKFNFHDSEPLVILNYNQLDSQKFSPIVCECRGLVLNYQYDWGVVAKPFSRFFNFAEVTNISKVFNWEDFTVKTKEDGTLFIVYFYNGSWRVNTRNSFGGFIVGESGKTWNQWFSELVNFDGCPESWKSYTFVFEFCSIWNQVVRLYEKPQLFLLDMIHNKTFQEISSVAPNELNIVSSLLKVSTPETHDFLDVEHAKSFIKEKGDSSFEGFVFKDSNGLRFKFKNEDYVARHHLLGNNGTSLTAIRNLVPLLLKGEADEIKSYCPACLIPKINEVASKLDEILNDATAVYSKISHLTSQKEFAIKAKQLTKHSSLLFTARLQGISIKEVFVQSERYLIKVLEKCKN
jgi:hypothetical protein